MNSHDAASAAKTVIEAAEVDATDTELAKGRSAHDARFDRHVEVGGVQDGWVVAGHDLAEGDKFGVASALYSSMSAFLKPIVRRQPIVESSQSKSHPLETKKQKNRKQ